MHGAQPQLLCLRTREEAAPALSLTDGSVSQARSASRDKVPSAARSPRLLTALLIISTSRRPGALFVPKKLLLRYMRKTVHL